MSKERLEKVIDEITWKEQFAISADQIKVIADALISAGCVMVDEEKIYQAAVKWYQKYCNTAKLRPLAKEITKALRQ